MLLESYRHASFWIFVVVIIVIVKLLLTCTFVDILLLLLLSFWQKVVIDMQVCGYFARLSI